MFIRKSELYTEDPSKGRLMGLNCNFRSTPQVLSFVNEIFGQLMSGGAAEIDTDELWFDTSDSAGNYGADFVFESTKYGIVFGFAET